MTRFSIIILFLLSVVGLYASNENIVIENLTDVYRIIATSDGSAIKEVKNSQEMTFRARRTKGNAVASAFYSDDVSIDKASGAKAEYGMIDDDDIFYSDSKMCVMTFPLKKEGEKAKARFERTFKKPEFFCRIPLAEVYDVENYTVKIIIPSSLASKLSVTGRNLPATASRTEESTAKETTVIYTINDLKSHDDVSNSRPYSLTMPTLYVLGNFSGVNDLYRHMLSYTRLKHDPDSMKVVELAREITRDCTTDSARISTILDYVHDNIRYIAVEHGIYGHMPDLPSEVLRKRFGDCKGSASLLRAMLRGAGLDGRFVWIGTREIPTEWTEFPMMASGNHMIAATMTGDSLLYLDGTAIYNGLGQYPKGIRGRQTVVEDTDSTCIVGRVGTMPPAADTYSIDVSYTMADDNTVTADYVERVTGSFNSSFCNSYDNTAEAKRSDKFTNYLTRFRKGARAELTGLDRSKSGSQITGRLTVPNIVRAIGNDLYVDLNPYPDMSQLVIDTKNRHGADLWLGSTSMTRLTTRFAVPEGYAVAAMPDSLDVSNEWFSATVAPEAAADGSSVAVTFVLTISNPLIPFDSIEAYNADVRKVARALASQLQLSKSE